MCWGWTEAAVEFAGNGIQIREGIASREASKIRI